MTMNSVPSGESDTIGDPVEAPPVEPVHGFGHLTVRFIGTVLPLLTLALCLLIIMS